MLTRFNGLLVAAVVLAARAPARAQSCQQLSGVFSATVAGISAGSGSDSGSCGGAGPEQVFFYFAPRAGTYVFDTIGSDYDTVLYLRDAMGGEIACNDDLQPGVVTASRLEVALTAGQSVMVYLDSFEAGGNFVLRINANCPQLGRNDPRDLGSTASITVSGNTECGSFLSGGAACGDGGNNAPDAVFLYTAPAAGNYIIDTAGSGFDTLLAVRGDTCTEPTIACNDDVAPPSDDTSRVEMVLDDAQTVRIAVDGFGSASGAFTLNVRSTPFTPTVTRTRTSSRTRTPTSTATSSRTPTLTRTVTLTRTQTQTHTPTHTRTPSKTRTVTVTRSPTVSRTPTRTATASRTVSAVPSPTATRSSTLTASPTRSATWTPTPSATPSPTRTATPSSTPSPTASRTPTVTPSRTSSPTPSSTASSTPSRTLSPPPSATPSPSTTRTSAATATATPTTRPPAAPSDLRCQTTLLVAGWFARLDWSDNSFDESAFVAEEFDVALQDWLSTRTVGAGATFVVIGPLDAGLTIDYRVRAFRDGDSVFSLPSNVATCTTSAPTAPPTRTTTPLPSATQSATATPTRPQTGRCLAGRNGGYVCRIDFETLPDGSQPVQSSDVIRDQYRPEFGVSFPEGGWVVQPKRGTSSIFFALLNATSGTQQEFNPGPLRLAFAAPGVKRLRLRAGLDQSIAGVRPQLTVFDESGARSQTLDGTAFATGPVAVDQLLDIAPPDFDIRRAELFYTGDTPTARNAVELIDDVEVSVDTLPSCPPGTDHTAPVVTILRPFADDRFSAANLPLLRATIREDSGRLGPVTVEIESLAARRTLDVGPYVERDEFDASKFNLVVQDVALYEDDNAVTVRALDTACAPNLGEAKVSVKVEPPPATMNLYALGLEITQAVQDRPHLRGLTLEPSDPRLLLPLPYAAGIPLVARKLIAVRAYAGIEGTTEILRGVPARLVVRRAGTTTVLRGSPIDVDPADNVLAGGALDVAQTAARRRAARDKGWLFVLPLSLTEAGTIDSIELQVNPSDLLGPRECAACNDGANSLAVAGLTLRRTAQMSILVVHVRDKASRLETSDDAGPRTLCDSAQKSFPVAEGCGTHPANGFLLSKVTKEYDSTDWVPGVTKSDEILREVACKARSRGLKGSVYNENLVLAPPASAGVPFGTGFGGSGCAAAPDGDWPTAIHEIGHSWQLCHTPCGNPPDLCSGYPFAGGVTGDEGLQTNRLVVLPRSSFDWMTYCNDYGDPPDFRTWVSGYVYRNMFRGLQLPASAPLEQAAAISAESPQLLASGTIRDGTSVELAPFYVLDQEPEPQASEGAYAIELHGEDGELLTAYPFDAEQLPEGPGVETFHLVLPFDARTTLIELRRNGEVMAQRPVSPEPPDLSDLSPAGGERWEAGGGYTIRWEASDPDGDDLHHLVQYSADGGTTWLTIAEDLTGRELEVSGSDLPGSDDALVRVIASDGVLSTALTSGSFSVAFKDPRLWIGGAADNDVVEPGAILNLQANYLDPDGQAVADDVIVWRSDRLGVLGRGPHIELAAAHLPAGANRISVTLPGKVAPTVSASVTILRVGSGAEIEVPCAADCNENELVTVDDLVVAARVANHEQSIALCPSADADGDGDATPSELVAGVTNALRGCTR